MKLIIVITALITAVVATNYKFNNFNNNNNANNRDNLNERAASHQRFILNLLRHLKDDLNRDMKSNDYKKYSHTIVLDNKNDYQNLKTVYTFMTLWQNGWFMKRNKPFSMLDERNIITTKVAFDFFDTMTNWNVFAKNLIFCRCHMNEYQFWYLITLLVQHNQYMDNIVLPPAYEVLPTQFFTGDVLNKGIQTAIKGITNSNNKVVVMQNYTNGILGSNDDDENANYNDLNKIENKINDWNTLKQVAQKIQRQQQLTNTQNIQNLGNKNKEIKTTVNNNIRQQNQGNKFNNNGEDQLNYFTEDIGLNNYFYFSRMDNSRIVNDNQMYNNVNNKDKFQKLTDTNINSYQLNDKINRRGERYLYQLQQLVARFNLERLSNNMDNIKSIDLDGNVDNGVFANLQLTNGLQMQNRQNNYQLNTEQNQKLIDMIKNFENRFYQAIDQGFVQTQNGNKIDLRNKDGINILGNLLQDNQNNVNQQFYRNLEMYLRALLGGNYVKNLDRTDNRFMTTVMSTHETALRDPVFWQIMKRITDITNKYKSKLTGYTKNDLNFKGVQINTVNVDKMVTVFSYFDADITNAFNEDLINMCKKNNNGNNNNDNNNDSSDSSSDSSDSNSDEDNNNMNYNNNYGRSYMNKNFGNNKNNNYKNMNKNFGRNNNNNNNYYDSSDSSSDSSDSNSDENNNKNYGGNNKNNNMNFGNNGQCVKTVCKNGVCNTHVFSCNKNNKNNNNNMNKNFKYYNNNGRNNKYNNNDNSDSSSDSSDSNDSNSNENFNMNNNNNNERNYNNNNNGRSFNNQYNNYKNMMGNNNNNKFQIIARQRRLDSKKFIITIGVKSNQNQLGIVRIFLGPRINNKQQLNDNRQNYVELDQFVVQLKQGQNTIQRQSVDFKNIVDDPLTASKLVERTKNHLKKDNNKKNTNNDNNKNLYNVNFDTNNNNNGFPHQLILPKGTKDGQEYTLFVTINDLDNTNNNNVNYWNNKNWNNFVKSGNNNNNNNNNGNTNSDDLSESSDLSSSLSNSDSNENNSNNNMNYRNWFNKFNNNNNNNGNNNNWNKFNNNNNSNDWCNHQGVKIYNCNNGNKNIGNGNGILDKRAMGFPLDRNIMDVNGFVVDNMYFKKVVVVHMDTNNNN